MRKFDCISLRIINYFCIEICPGLGGNRAMKVKIASEIRNGCAMFRCCCFSTVLFLMIC